ncbi:hypothetical protein Nepgr_017629 [Nepenthes gracilis]|uniref:Uncharacterized protein n=1 Tax=Nepenthes gracilis TaxID=150966 RepID=A0AAD3SQQ9_NEPGR|nr:hypothetical protein Nepgr_017629 [Nepenthes gracilis]
MGNCCGGGSSMAREGEEWGSVGQKLVGAEEKEGLHGDRSSPPRATVGREVRIRISKKQLADLLEGVNGRGLRGGGKTMSAEQILERLLEKSDHHFEIHRHRSWRPVLLSIPEVE